MTPRLVRCPLKRVIAVAFYIWASLIVAAIAPAAAQEAKPAKLNVVASFSILGDMVRKVVGDAAAVTVVVGPDRDAHTYAPNVQDAVAVTHADIIFVNGMGFETWFDALARNSGTKAKIITATTGIDPLLVDGTADPHAWNALTNGMIYVRNIAAAMAAQDPPNAGAYLERADDYIAELQALDTLARETFDTLAKDRRTVVTAHDAFGYLEAAYDLRFLAPLGISSDAEPSARAMAELIAQIKAEKVSALFVENIKSPALIEQLSAETGVAIGGRLYSDALSERGGPATSYIAMFEHNLKALQKALTAQ